jgi:hypothetical protein
MSYVPGSPSPAIDTAFTRIDSAASQPPGPLWEMGRSAPLDGVSDATKDAVRVALEQKAAEFRTPEHGMDHPTSHAMALVYYSSNPNELAALLPEGTPPEEAQQVLDAVTNGVRIAAPSLALGGDVTPHALGDLVDYSAGLRSSLFDTAENRARVEDFKNDLIRNLEDVANQPPPP